MLILLFGYALSLDVKHVPIAVVLEDTSSQGAEIAAVKLPDLNTADIEAAKRQVEGTARSMGIAVAG